MNGLTDEWKKVKHENYTSTQIRFEFKVEDFWIGAFWNRSESYNSTIDRIVKILDVWICVIPCFPLHLTFKKFEV